MCNQTAWCVEHLWNTTILKLIFQMVYKIAEGRVIKQRSRWDTTIQLPGHSISYCFNVQLVQAQVHKAHIWVATRVQRKQAGEYFGDSLTNPIPAAQR